jgi:hypothetical protein
MKRVGEDASSFAWRHGTKKGSRCPSSLISFQETPSAGNQRAKNKKALGSHKWPKGCTQFFLDPFS